MRFDLFTVDFILWTAISTTEEVIGELFRSLSPVKKNEAEAEDFLGSLLGGFMTAESSSAVEPSTQQETEGKIQSNRLTVWNSTNTKLETEDNDDYKPSEELLAMFNTLTSGNDLNLDVREYLPTAGHIKLEPENPDGQLTSTCISVFIVL